MVFFRIGVIVILIATASPTRYNCVVR